MQTLIRQLGMDYLNHDYHACSGILDYLIHDKHYTLKRIGEFLQSVYTLSDLQVFEVFEQLGFIQYH